jgi:hypothetical protein
MSIEGTLMVLGLTCLAVALVLGGVEERAFVIAQAASGIAEHYVVRAGDVPAAVLVDLAVLAVMMPVALTTKKVWPLVVTSLCIATLMSEAAQMLVHAGPRAYGVMQSSWDLLADVMVAAGAVGVWMSRRADRARVGHP